MRTIRNKNSKIFLGTITLSFLCAMAAAQTENLPPLPKGPLILTSIKPEQFSADYWINRLPDPDRLINNVQELKTLNEDTRAMVRDQVDIFQLPLARNGQGIRDQIELEYNTIQGRILFGVNDAYIPKSLFAQDIKPVEQWEKVPNQIRVRWGAATQATSVRALPSDVKMLEQKGDIEFDQLQFTLIKLWTPIAIYHESSDGKWFYVQAPYARGWVKAKDIALFPNRNALQKYSKSGRFLVATGESISIFSDPELTARLQAPSMGTIFPLQNKTDKAYVIWLPYSNPEGGVIFKKAYISLNADVSIGFLPFTQRNIIRQAFKMLGARYGWGGTYNGRDCSAFTQDVFLTVGVDMPRGSKEQSFVGTQLGAFEYKEDTAAKQAALQPAVPGITIIRMPHHLMLYLGQADGQFYVIHCTWAERYSMTSDAKNRINQVVVSDLTLNGKSYLGSLFDRIIAMNEIN